jgi:hypothetical protein
MLGIATLLGANLLGMPTYFLLLVCFLAIYWGINAITACKR